MENIEEYRATISSVDIDIIKMLSKQQSKIAKNKQNFKKA